MSTSIPKYEKYDNEVSNELVERSLNISGVNCKEESLLSIVSATSLYFIARIVNITVQRAKFQEELLAAMSGENKRKNKLNTNKLKRPTPESSPMKDPIIKHTNHYRPKKLTLMLDDLEAAMSSFGYHFIRPIKFPKNRGI
jgi:hypothetical protein